MPVISASVLGDLLLDVVDCVFDLVLHVVDEVLDLGAGLIGLALTLEADWLSGRMAS